ncbi:MAG: hypothetical protein JST42_27315 [Bacteroidetes bacterium]|nr:hypothetical protein [Bacteroidota bacterium]
MLLYCRHTSPRLRYIAGFFSKELFAEPIRITTDKAAFIAAAGPRINYSEEDIPGVFTIAPASLLFETGVTPRDLPCFEYNGRKAFFATSGDFPFDIFAAAFYLISRYEEYLPHEKDEYGRYAHTNSLAWKEGFLDTPLVNYWLLDLREALLAMYPRLVFRHPEFTFIPTYDIDLAWSFLHKGWRRILGAAAKELMTGKWRQLRHRIAVLRGRRNDPFDAYEWLDALHLYCRMKPYYFFLVASRCSGVDRNIPPTNTSLQELIAYHAMGYRLGIHPSWRSGDKEGLLQEEIDSLEKISGKRITRSRQHYIRFTLPATYRSLLAHGIGQDFSMGYGSINGFRASVASSYSWYDLQKEEETGLTLMPFCFMDANSYYEQRYTATQAMTELLHYYHHIRKVNGLMVTVWHNTFLGTDPGKAGWREVYETFLKEEVYWD